MASDQNHRSQSLMARVQEAAEQGARLHTDIVREFLDDLQVRFPATIGLLGGLVGTLIGLVIGTTLLVVTVPQPRPPGRRARDDRLRLAVRHGARRG